MTSAELDDGEDVTVRFTRTDEVWEVVISLDLLGEGPGLVEIEHNWTVPAV